MPAGHQPRSRRCSPGNAYRTTGSRWGEYWGVRIRVITLPCGGDKEMGLFCKEIKKYIFYTQREIKLNDMRVDYKNKTIM
uniref:Uncharacterized protein n=1 Tax=Lutzomyia longipalpis TaxID=7200 RepID=A0A1B0CEK4_LUTLO